MRKLFLLLLLFPLQQMLAQTSITGRVETGLLAARPAVCLPGDLYTATDDGPNGTIYKCGPANTWTAISSALNSPVTSPNPLAFDVDLGFKGPNPWNDITRYGARSVASFNTHPAIPGTTITVGAGSTSATVNNADFVTNDFISIQGAGAACDQATPGAPTVTPSVASGPANTGMVVNAPAGATTSNYKIVAVGKNGCFSAASASGGTTTGNAGGFQSIGIASATKSNNVNSYVTSSAHGLSVNSLAIIIGTADDANFGGQCIVATAVDNTHFTCNNSQSDTRSGAAASIGSGGTVGWINSNHMTWTATPNSNTLFYLIYNASGGIIGVSKIQNTTGSPNIIDQSWDDYGASFSGTPVFPSGWFPSTPPASSNPATFTVQLTGASGTNLTLASGPTTGVTNAIVLLDNGPALVAATASGGAYIPYGNFVVNSYTKLVGNAAQVGIVQQGTLGIASTIEIPAITQWFGNVMATQTSNPAFANGGGPPIFCFTSQACIFSPAANSTLKMRGLNISTQLNGYGMVLDNNNAVMNEHLNFNIPGNDNVGMPVLVRNAAFEQDWFNTTLIAGQSGNSTTPLFFCNRCATLRIRDMNLSARGIFMNGFQLFLDYGRKQGGPAPAIYRAALAGASDVGGVPDNLGAGDDYIGSYELDTDGDPLIVTLQPSGAAGMSVLHIKYGAPGPGLGQPIVSGALYPSVISEAPYKNPYQPFSVDFSSKGFYGSSAFSTNGHPTYGVGGLMGQTKVNMNTDILGGNGVTVHMYPPTATAAVTTTGCTSKPPAGTYTYFLAVISTDGVLSTIGPASNAITLDGTTQCGLLTWTDVQPTIGYRVFVRQGAGNIGEIVTGTCAGPVAANTCTDIHVSTVGSVPLLSGAGNPSFYPGLLNTNKLRFGSSSGSNYGFMDWTGNFTAQRKVTVPDVGNAFLPITGYQNSAYDPFNRANESPLSNGGKWTVGFGTTALATNVVSCTAAPCATYWNANLLGADEFVQGTITTVGNNIGVTARMSGTGGTTAGYMCLVNATTVFLMKSTAGSWSTITSTGITLALGDVIRFEVIGSTLTCYQNGISRISTTDTTVTSGTFAGIGATGVAGALDNWSGGNIHPLAQLDTEQDWTQPQHFIGPVTVGAVNPIAGALTAGNEYVSGQIAAVGGVTTGSNPPAVTPGTSGLVALNEGTAPTGVANVEILHGGNSSDHMLYQLNNNANDQPVAVRGLVTSAYTNATTTASNITGLSFGVAASKNYIMTCHLYYQASAGTAGLDITITGPASPTSVFYSYDEDATATTLQDSVANAFGTKLTGNATVTATPTNLHATVTLGLVNGANAGTVQVQGSATGVGTVTVQPGSFCTLQ